jgi:hypothetical protein
VLVKEDGEERRWRHEAHKESILVYDREASFAVLHSFPRRDLLVLSWVNDRRVGIHERARGHLIRSGKYIFNPDESKEPSVLAYDDIDGGAERTRGKQAARFVGSGGSIDDWDLGRGTISGCTGVRHDTH